MLADRDLTGITESIRRELAASDPAILQRYPVEGYLAELAAMDPYGGYRRLPSTVVDRCARIAGEAGQQTLETYHRLVLATLLSRFDRRFAALAVPASIAALTRSFLGQICLEIEKPRKGYFDHGNDRFAKDLAVCQARMLPCGPEVVDLYSGFPRRGLLAAPRGEIFGRLMFFLGEVRGFRPLYETHMDRRLIREFSPEGYVRCYLRLAELLGLNPAVKGVMLGATWFVDPALETISPELSYLRTVPVSAGARLFPAHTTDHAIRDATRMSPLRKRLFDEGRYRPRSYMIVWPRRCLIEWAERQREAAPAGAAPERTQLGGPT